MTVCFNRSYRRGDEWQNEAAFVRCEAWGKPAERMNELLGKGKIVNVEGFITQENWTNRENEKRSMLTLRVERFQPCEKLKSGAAGDGEPTTAPQNEPSRSDQDDVSPADDDDGDIPF